MTNSCENPPPLTDILRSIPKQFAAERDVYRVPLENGESFIFKPALDEEPANDRDAYVPQDELAVYNKSKSLQGRYIPICYGLVTLRGKVGLLMEDCGSKTFENPPLDENTKFILFLRAMCAMERCLAAGLVHQDAEFRNIVYNPVTLQVGIIDIEIPQYERYKPQDPPGMQNSFDRSIIRWLRKSDSPLWVWISPQFGRIDRTVRSISIRVQSTE